MNLLVADSAGHSVQSSSNSINTGEKEENDNDWGPPAPKPLNLFKAAEWVPVIVAVLLLLIILF